MLLRLRNVQSRELLRELIDQNVYGLYVRSTVENRGPFLIRQMIRLRYLAVYFEYSLTNLKLSRATRSIKNIDPLA